MCDHMKTRFAFVNILKETHGPLRFLAISCDSVRFLATPCDYLKIRLKLPRCGEIYKSIFNVFTNKKLPLSITVT